MQSMKLVYSEQFLVKSGNLTTNLMIKNGEQTSILLIFQSKFSREAMYNHNSRIKEPNSPTLIPKTVKLSKL